MLVLNKVDVKASGFVKGFLVKALIEEAAHIAEYLGLDDEDIINGGWGNFQLASHQRCVYFFCDSDQFAVHRQQRAAKALGQRHKKHVIRGVLVFDGQ